MYTIDSNLDRRWKSCEKEKRKIYIIRKIIFYNFTFQVDNDLKQVGTLSEFQKIDYLKYPSISNIHDMIFIILAIKIKSIFLVTKWHSKIKIDSISNYYHAFQKIVLNYLLTFVHTFWYNWLYIFPENYTWFFPRTINLLSIASSRCYFY